MPVFHRWLEFPFLSGFDSPLVQSHSERIGHADVGGTPVGIHDEHERACPLIFRLARFLRKLRIDLIDHARGAHAPADMKYPAAGPAALTGTEPRSLTGSNATARTRSNSAARTSSVRRQYRMGDGIAQTRE